MAEDRPESPSMYLELTDLIRSCVTDSIKTGIDLSIKIGKSDLTGIDFSDQSVEIDDTLVSLIDSSWSSWRNSSG